MRFAFLSITVFTLLLAGHPAHAQGDGLFGGAGKLDPSFCTDHQIRQTVIYIDDSMLVTGQNDWLRNIYDKLKATLMPGERTTLVELAPAAGESTERWSGCWPAYTPEQAAKLRGQFNLFSSDPMSKVANQQGYFARDLGVAVANIEKVHARPASQVMVSLDNPPRQSVIRALVADAARYSHTQETVRAILYSNLFENSDLGSSFKLLPSPSINYGAKLGTFLHRSVFYVFGIGSNIGGDGSVQDSIRAFWIATLQSMAANVGGIGTDLSIPNVVPVASHNFDLLLKDSGSTLTGRLSLLTGSDGTLVDSWIGVVRLRTAALNGTYSCTGSTDAPSCTLQATTTGGVVTMSPSETISLSGHDTPTLTGTIGVQGSNVDLPLAAEPAKN